MPVPEPAHRIGIRQEGHTKGLLERLTQIGKINALVRIPGSARLAFDDVQVARLEPAQLLSLYCPDP